MQKLKFVQSYYNSVLYLNNNKTYIAVYVNNLYIVRPDLPLIVKLKNKLIIKFKTTNLGPTSHYLRMEVLHNNHTITVIQIVYINQLLVVYQILDCNPAYISIIEGLCLASALDNYVPYPKNICAYQKFTRSI